MKPRSYPQILDTAVAGRISERVDLTPRILGAVRTQKVVRMQPRMKLAATILLAVLAALALSTAVYAVYRWITDPGLRSVQDAGLVTDLNITARPTLLPTSGEVLPAGQATSIGLNQTLEGITLTLDWIYLDESRLALGIQYTPLPPDLRLDAPRVSFIGLTPLQSYGYSQSFRSDENQAVYVSYQIIHADEAGGKVNLSLDVPLVRSSGGEKTALADFHFDLHEIPIYRGQTLPIQQIYSVQRNGVEVRLKAVRIMPSAAEVVACYDFISPDVPFTYMQNTTLQIGEGPEEGYRTYEYLSEIKDDHCVKLGFATGNADGEKHLFFRVHRLVVPLTMQDALPPERIKAANHELAQYGIEIKPAPPAESEGPGGWQFVRKPEPGTDPAKDPALLVIQALEEKMDGLWEFYVDIPSSEIIPGQAKPAASPTPAALGEQTIEGVTFTLDWAFADAKRVGVGFTITGLPDTPEATALYGQISIRDENGNPVGGSGVGSSNISRVEGQPGTLHGSWSAGFTKPLNVTEARFQLEITLDGSQMNEIIAGFETPPEATPYPPGVFPPRLPDHLVGSYVFDFTVPVYPLVVIGAQPPVSTNNLAMQIVRAEITASTSEVMLCYTKPSAKDWWVMKALPKNTSEEASLSGGMLITDTDFNMKPLQPDQWAAPAEYQNMEHGRCIKLEFLLGPAGGTEPLTLTIPRLEQSVPEVLPDAELQAAREILRTQGIEFDTTIFSSAAGGGGGGITFTRLPDGMSWQDAYDKYLEALGYVYSGPWVFRLPSTP